MEYVIGAIIGFILCKIFTTQKTENDIYVEKIESHLEVFKKRYFESIEIDAYNKYNFEKANKELDYFITNTLGFDKESLLGKQAKSYILNKIHN